MKIWFTEIGEPLPLEKEVRLHRYGILTQAFAQQGHEVTWWSSTFSHAKKIFVLNHDDEIKINGVMLKLIHGPGYKRNISFQRFKHQAYFAKRFDELARGEPKPDIIISPVPTLEVAEVATRFGREFKIPVLTDIRDEWPDEFVDLAPKFLRPFARLALREYFKKMNYICNNVTGILGISERQLNYGLSFANRSKKENDGIFPIGYQAKKPDPTNVSAAKKWWASQGVTGKPFTCCLFSTINPFLNLRTVIESAKILSQEFEIQFVLCGDGRSLKKLKKLAKDIPSVIFPGWVDGPQIAALLELSHVGLAPYAAKTRMSLPNKPFEYMAGGLPIVSSIQGELQGVLAKNNCGITYNPDSVSELCDILRDLHGNRKKREELGQNARNVLDREFSSEAIFKRLNEHIETVIQGSQHWT